MSHPQTFSLHQGPAASEQLNQKESCSLHNTAWNCSVNSHVCAVIPHQGSHRWIIKGPSDGAICITAWARYRACLSLDPARSSVNGSELYTPCDMHRPLYSFPRTAVTGSHKHRWRKTTERGLPWWSSGLWLCAPNARDPGSFPGQETWSHMPQQRLKTPRAATEPWHSQVNK